MTEEQDNFIVSRDIFFTYLEPGSQSARLGLSSFLEHHAPAVAEFDKQIMVVDDTPMNLLVLH